MPTREFRELFRERTLCHMGSFSGSPTTVAIDATTDWVGGEIIAPITGTIDRLVFMVSSVSTPSGFDLEMAITELDANRYPLGADIAVSSSVAASTLVANSTYSLTISASVTRGTSYGIILRVKSGGSVTGSVTVRGYSGPQWNGLLPGHPLASSRTGASPASTQNWAAFNARWSDGRYYFTPGLSGAYYQLSAATTSNHTNKIVANKITFDHPITIMGYTWNSNPSGNTTVGTFNASGGLVTGTGVSRTTSLRQWTGNGNAWYLLPAPVVLPAGTYYFGERSDGNQTTTLNTAKFHEVACAEQLFGWWGQATLWNGSAWVDETGECCAAFPILSALPAADLVGAALL